MPRPPLPSLTQTSSLRQKRIKTSSPCPSSSTAWGMSWRDGTEHRGLAARGSQSSVRSCLPSSIPLSMAFRDKDLPANPIGLSRFQSSPKMCWKNILCSSLHQQNSSFCSISLHLRSLGWNHIAAGVSFCVQSMTCQCPAGAPARSQTFPAQHRRSSTGSSAAAKLMLKGFNSI